MDIEDIGDRNSNITERISNVFGTQNVTVAMATQSNTAGVNSGKFTIPTQSLDNRPHIANENEIAQYKPYCATSHQ